MKSDPLSKQPWRKIFFNRRILICIFLGFSSGLPLYTLTHLLQAWLYSKGVSLEAIGLFALIQLPYAWKFIWAPLLDRYTFRFFGQQFGRRRSWMLLTQIFVTAAMMCLGFVSPTRSLIWVSVLTTLVALFSASQDIVIDAYRRELLAESEQGLGNATYVNAYKIASLIPGSLALILSDHVSWEWVFIINGLFMLPGILLTLWVKEPKIYGEPPKNLKEAVVLPFKEFIGRKGWSGALLVIGFIFLYKVGDAMAGNLSTSFFLNIGFSRTEIATVAKFVASTASLLGGILGGMALVRYGIAKGLWVFGILQIIATLSFAWLAQISHSLTIMGIVLGFETFSTGLTLAAFVAYIASTTDLRYAATQFALFTSLAALPRAFAAGASGYLVDYLGWTHYFIFCALLGVPGLLLLCKVAPWSASHIEVVPHPSQSQED